MPREPGRRPPWAAELAASVRSDLPLNAHVAERVTLFVWRLGQSVHGRAGAAPFLGRRVHSLVDALWVRGLMGAELPRNVRAGHALRLPHGGRGVIVHPSVDIGRDVTLYHRVTLGVRNGQQGPRIGDGVYIGAGATVIGPIVVGERARIGAGAVVLADVSAGALAVGVPARERRHG